MVMGKGRIPEVEKHKTTAFPPPFISTTFCQRCHQEAKEYGSSLPIKRIKEQQSSQEGKGTKGEAETR